MASTQSTPNYTTSERRLNISTSTSYTLSEIDNGNIVRITNAAPITLNVPTGLSIGFSCEIIQGGLGDITLTEVGTTINSYGSLKTIAGRYASASILCDSTNIFTLAGNLK